MSTSDMHIKKWDSVCVWTYSAQQDKCTICRESLQGPCINCLQIRQSGVKNDCSVVVGQCNHRFHSHCIAHWLITHQVCPLDHSAWEYAS
ncbi:MAG: putative RING-box protein 1a [Streblomastix strix]|uniref:Putative RING-box protein 1a n=1 Tax=Streblomastix strix TaxID=222440 RepID=A0A5J4X240_9EUKA|nr:MAG: putative RING-box protein 1a [Streblomastix strix]